MTIDPIQMARFLVLPGAEELLDAFARIPDGPLRAATVSQVRAIADQYTGAAPVPSAEDPLATAARFASQPAVAAALPPPPEAKAKAKGKHKHPEEQIIALRMEGKGSKAISKETGFPRQKVQAVLNDANRGGLKFPPRKDIETGKTFVTNMDDLTGQGAHQMRGAALKLGKSLEEYIDARATFAKMRAEGRPMDLIAETIKFPEETCWKWLYAARQAGLDLPLRSEEIDGEFEDIWPPPYESLTEQGRGAARAAADEAGLSVQDYQARQRQIVDMRKAGEAPATIMEQLSLSKWQVVKLLQRARAHGIKFPPLPNWRELDAMTGDGVVAHPMARSARSPADA